MTCDERIEKLLNRAGQTISDLPSPIDYNIEQEELAMEAAADFGGGLEAYILHLTDVIDRMETALENVCGERDYLRQTAGVDGCWTCTNSDSGPECHRPGGCVLNDEGRCVGYEYAGIPEDWRPDDD